MALNMALNEIPPCVSKHQVYERPMAGQEDKNLVWACPLLDVQLFVLLRLAWALALD